MCCSIVSLGCLFSTHFLSKLVLDSYISSIISRIAFFVMSLTPVGAMITEELWIFFD